MIANAMDPV